MLLWKSCAFDLQLSKNVLKIVPNNWITLWKYWNEPSQELRATSNLHKFAKWTGMHVMIRSSFGLAVRSPRSMLPSVSFLSLLVSCQSTDDSNSIYDGAKQRSDPIHVIINKHSPPSSDIQPSLVTHAIQPCPEIDRCELCWNFWVSGTNSQMFEHQNITGWINISNQTTPNCRIISSRWRRIREWRVL